MTHAYIPKRAVLMADLDQDGNRYQCWLDAAHAPQPRLFLRITREERTQTNSYTAAKSRSQLVGELRAAVNSNRATVRQWSEGFASVAVVGA